MAQQLFWFETLLKFISGVLLLVAPVSLARLMGLPHGQVGFWARILELWVKLVFGRFESWRCIWLV